MSKHIHIHLYAGANKTVPAKDEKPCSCSSHDEHLGFEKLKNKLAHKKGVTNPAALAASIGRKKLGTANFEKRAEAGKK